MLKQVPDVARNLLEQVFDIRRRIHPMLDSTSDSSDAFDIID